MLSVYYLLTNDCSTDDGSGESEADFTSATLSLAARNNPYVHQDSVQLQMLPLDVTSKKSYRYTNIHLYTK